MIISKFYWNINKNISYHFFSCYTKTIAFTNYIKVNLLISLIKYVRKDAIYSKYIKQNLYIQLYIFVYLIKMIERKK